jgi:hydrogenase-4 component B
MNLFITAIAVLLLGGTASLLTGNNPRLATRLGAGGIFAGCVLGLISAALGLYSEGPAYLQLAWQVPFGSFSLGMDALSAFFLLPIFGLSGIAALYGSEYMAAYHGKKFIGAHWFFMSVLVAGMAMVVTARDGLLFIVSWEVMSIAPFFLVTFNDEKESVRSAGWTYLVAAHLGALPIIALFILLGRGAGSLEFASFNPAALTAGMAGLLFVLAVVGFGTKAGFFPLHVWLPEAHPAAPSHVSAVMSGVMIKTGIYGVIRVLTFLGPPPAWWGTALIVVGLASGLLGIIFAISQHELKRLLAYSSVENIGVISLGLGMGLLGKSLNSPALSVIGFGGAIFHVLNHALFKGLLFLGAGAVLHSSGTADLDRLGGLMKRMPVTGAAFLAGAAAISGLPPFNGFAGEFLVYFSAATGGIAFKSVPAVAAWLVFAGLAMIGGLATACFTKAFGTVFLGEPRTAYAEHAHDPGPMMRISMAALAAACLSVGLLAPVVLRAMAPALSVVTGYAASDVVDIINRPSEYLVRVSVISLALILLTGALYWLRGRLLKGRVVGSSPTWDCGYAKTTARMQYTASSFSQPMTAIMAPVLRINSRIFPPSGLFPRAASFSTDVPGGSREYIYRPLFNWVAATLNRFRWLQRGKTHIYVLYIAITLVALLIWKL